MRTFWMFLLAGTVLFGVAVSDGALGSEVPDRFSLEGLEGVPFPEEAQEMLRQNGFVVTPGHDDEIFDIYKSAKERGQPMFVTTDATLHTAHIFFDFLLRILEIERLNDMADELTDRMLEMSVEQYQEATDALVKELAQCNIGYFAVAKKLLHPDARVKDCPRGLIEQELNNIADHQGFAPRALLTYVHNPNMLETPYAYEDYSQYVPRGHYTRNEIFERYFQVMMWYGRIDFKLRPGTREPALTHGRKMTLQALLMTDAFLRDKELFKLWQQIYEPTTYFVGRTDDLHAEDYVRLIRKIYPAKGTVDKYGDMALLDKFIEGAVGLRPPKILSGAAFVENGEFATTTQGFRFMGQRFIPDSYMFQELVFGRKGEKKILHYRGEGKPFTMENIPNEGPARAFPRGLDIMAVLGSARALEILEREGDTEYTFFDEQLGRLRDEFAAQTRDDWKQNLYWRWLHALRPLLHKPQGESVPQFMTGVAWLDKALQTALGSWTQLRHDTILYAKQSYTMMAKAMPPKPRESYGYVEPYPEVYERLGEMMRDLRQHLSELGIAMEEIMEKLIDFENLLNDLQVISEKELVGQALSEEEYRLVRNIGGRLATLKMFPEELMNKITSGTDEKMDIVADVHTDPNTSQVLEEGVGSAYNIYVIVDDAMGRRICRGGVFSYYEFKHSLADRLTDEAWQRMGQEGQRPDQPEWVQSFTAR